MTLSIDSTDLAALRSAVAGLSDKLRTGHLDDDERGRFPAEKWRMLAQQGIFGLLASPEYGGLGQDLLVTMGVLEELGQCCPDAGLNFSVSTQIASSIVPIGRFGSDQLRATYLPGLVRGELIGAHAITEPEAGSDALAGTTTATADGDTVTLRGAKAFVSNGPIADLVVVYARPGSGSGLTAVVVPTDSPGLSRGTPIKKMGLRTSPLCELFLDDVRVPRSHVLGRPGNGYFVLDYVMKREILLSFTINVGEMAARLRTVVDHVRSRHQFGAPLSTFQAVSHQVVAMRMAQRTARLWLFETAARLLANRDVTEDIAIAKIIASEAALSTARTALHLHGGYGFMAEYGIEKQVRDTSAGPIYSGSNEIQTNKIAQILGL